MDNPQKEGAGSFTPLLSALATSRNCFSPTNLRGWAEWALVVTKIPGFHTATRLQGK
jgi:hypothetical protein